MTMNLVTDTVPLMLWTNIDALHYLWICLFSNLVEVERVFQVLGLHLLSFSTPSNWMHVTVVFVPMNYHDMNWYTCCLTYEWEYHSNTRLSKDMQPRAAEVKQEIGGGWDVTSSFSNFYKCCMKPVNATSKWQLLQLTSGHSKLWFCDGNVRIWHWVFVTENCRLI